MTPSSSHVFARFLTDLFPSAAAMSAFVRSFEGMKELSPELPGDNVSAMAMADALAQHLSRRGLVTEEFFQDLASIRPGHVAAISESAAKFGLHLDPVALKLSQDRSTILLDPEGADLITLKVVSRMVGKSWNVRLSEHRIAVHAARDIFAATFLGDDKLMTTVMSRDEYRLCQGGHSFGYAIISEVINPGLPVHIERRQEEYMAMASPRTKADGGRDVIVVSKPRPPVATWVVIGAAALAISVGIVLAF